MRLCCKHPLWYFFALKAHFRTFHRLWMKSKKCISLRETWQSVGGWSTGPEETRLSINDTAPQSLLCQDIIDKARKVCPKNVQTGVRHCPAITKRHSPTGKHSSGGGERRQICPGTWQKYVRWLLWWKHSHVHRRRQQSFVDVHLRFPKPLSFPNMLRIMYTP